MDSSNFKVVCDHCDAKLANFFCHSDGAFLCPQCDAQVHSVNKLAQRHLRVPCQSCPVWAYREAKARGRLLDMPLAACLTRNLQLDIFDGTMPCWPSNNASSVAMGTPQSDTSSPQATTTAAPANAGSPNSEVHTATLQQASNSWPQNSALAVVVSQVNPQSNLGSSDQADTVRPPAQIAISPFSNGSGGSLMAAVNAPLHSQPVPEECSMQIAQVSRSDAEASKHLSQRAQSQHSHHTLQRAASQEVMDAVDSMDVALLLDTFGTPADQMQDTKCKTDILEHQGPQQQEQAQQPRMTQQQQAVAEPESQSGAVCSSSSMAPVTATAALGNPVCMSSNWAPMVQQAQTQQQQLLLQRQQMLQEQLQQQQRQAQMNAAAAAAVCLAPQSIFGMSSSEPVAVPVQRQQPAMRTLSGLSCLSQSGLSSSNTDGQQLGSARSSNTMLLQSLEQQMTGVAAASTCAVPMSLAGIAGPSGSAATMAAAAAWPNIETTQRQLQQLQQQQQATLQYLQQKQQQQKQVAAALAVAQQQKQQQQAIQQLLQRSRTEDLSRTSPITIGNGTATAALLTAAAARRDASLRAGLGLSDPGIGLGRAWSLAQSPVSLQPSAVGTTFALSSCSLLDNLSGLGMDPSSIAAAAAGGVAIDSLTAAAITAGGLLPGAVTLSGATPAPAPQPQLASIRSFDAAASSFSALPAPVVGSGGSTSVSPSNCNTLAGAISERHLPLTAQQLAQQLVLPGSAPPALGLAASVSMVSRGGSCDLSDSQLMRLSNDGYDAVLGAAATAKMLGGGIGMLALGGCDTDAAGLLTRLERPDGTYKELDPERAAQLNRYKQKRMLRMRALAEGPKKVRYECRKQLADTRPRVRGRFAKVNSSDALLDISSSGGGKLGCSMPSSSGNNVTNTGSVVSGSACTAPPGMMFHGPTGVGWGLHGHASAQPHMQRIEEEGASEGQSPFMLQRAGSLSLRQQMSSSGPETVAIGAITAAGEGLTTAMAAEPAETSMGGVLSGGFGSVLSAEQARAQQQQQALQILDGLPQQQPCQLQRTQSSSMTDGPRMSGLAQAGLLSSCVETTTAADTGLGLATQDCVITEHDLAALGFDDLPQLSGGFSNAGNSNEDMDESAESMNDGNTTRKIQEPESKSEMCTPLHRASVLAMLPQAGGQLSVTQPSAATALTQPSLPQQQQQEQQLLRGQPLMPPQLTTATCSWQSQPQIQTQLSQQQQQAQPRLAVLDRPIMYGTDLSQFSAAQLSLLDSILTDQYRPSGPGGRH